MAGTGSGRTYSIKEVAALVGLPPSTLRYYEDVSVIPAIARDASSGHRIYTEDDLELLTWVSCLSASGMSIADMREYVRSGLGGERDISEFVTLLEQQDARLQEEGQIIELRREFLRTKIAYWRAIKHDDASEAERLDIDARALAERLKTGSMRSGKPSGAVFMPAPNAAPLGGTGPRIPVGCAALIHGRPGVQ